jgi:4-amino-4-deoxy-L-arabinose transferase
MKKSLLAILALFLFAYIVPLGARPFMIPDETRYAEVPREMLATGDWIVPRLAGVRYFEKPVLGYWLNATAMKLLGDNRFAARLPSALSVGLTALLLLVFIRRFTGNSFTAALAAAAFLVSPMVYAFGVFNVPDNALSLFLTAAMMSFFCAYTERRPRLRLAYLALFGGFVGLAFLTKGFLAFAVPVVAIVPFVAWERRWRDMFALPWLPIAAALVVALPWCAAIHLREPSFWHYFFWVEHVKRYASESAQHPEPFWFFLPHLAWGILPWVAALPAAVMGWRRTDPQVPLVRFAWCWFLFPFLFFSVSAGKIPTYILPCYPPLIVLVAWGLTRYFERQGRGAFDLGCSALSVVTGVAGIVLIASQWIDRRGFRIYEPNEAWKIAIVGGGAVAWSLFLVTAARSREAHRKALLFCMGPALLMIGIHFIIPAELEGKKMPGEFLAARAASIRPGSIVVSEAELAVAACYYFKRADVLVLNHKGELAWGLDFDDSRGRFLTLDGLKSMVDRDSGGSRVTLVLRRDHFDRYRRELPPPAIEDSFGRFVFVQY